MYLLAVSRMVYDNFCKSKQFLTTCNSAANDAFFETEGVGWVMN
jgi:hypothetical protein